MSVKDDIQALRRKIDRGIGQINQTIFDSSGTLPTRYLILLILAAFVFQLAQPVVMGDTDMWYHLSGGRLFWDQGELPDHPYFSFAFADRKWVAYFWGFQAVIYPVYEAFGYQGLVVCRALLFTAGFGMIAAFVYAGRRDHFNWLLVALAILYLLLMGGRGFQLRPHLVSYAMIPAFLYILEFRRNWLWILPLLTVAWANLHGVTWVVGATIIGAYFTEWFLARRRQRAEAPKLKHLLWLFACLPAMLINPFGWKLFLAPFAIPPNLDLLIGELHPLDPAIFASFQLSALNVSVATLATVLMLIIVIALSRGLVWGGVRLSHVMMTLSGLVLLTRGNRFLYEWALLSLPLGTCYVAQLRPAWHKAKNSLLPSLLVLALLAIPFNAFWRILPADFSKYPFNKEGLPTGVVDFLKQQKARGNLLMPPTYAGYTTWTLYPDILVHSDMEFPPFDAEAALEVSYATAGSAGAFTQLASNHPIDFVAVKLSAKAAGTMLETKQGFQPVFFDDTFVLYANEARQPRIVSDWQLNHLDPHDLLNTEKGDPKERLRELDRIRNIWPDGRRVNHAITLTLFKEKRYEEALAAAERFLALYPENPNSHFLVGDSLEQLNRYEAAIVQYRNAMPYADAAFRRTLQQHIGTCFYLSKDFAAAYAAFKQGINPFRRDVDAETRYQYAFSAIVVGDDEVAKLMLKSVLWDAPPDKQRLRSEAHALLDKLERGDIEGGSLVDFARSLFSASPIPELSR